MIQGKPPEHFLPLLCDPPHIETAAEFKARMAWLFEPAPQKPEQEERPNGEGENQEPSRRDAPIPRDDLIDGDEIDREERDLWRRIVEAPALAYDPEPQRQWIVEGIIPDETLTLLTGDGGIGKTTLALQLAVAMRTDGDWLGMKVPQEPVLFVTSEDDRKDVNLNLRAILKAEHKGLAHCSGLHVLPLADRDASNHGHDGNQRYHDNRSRQKRLPPDRHECTRHGYLPGAAVSRQTTETPSQHDILPDRDGSLCRSPSHWAATRGAWS
jgi:hypothetical protein